MNNIKREDKMKIKIRPTRTEKKTIKLQESQSVIELMIGKICVIRFWDHENDNLYIDEKVLEKMGFSIYN